MAKASWLIVDPTSGSGDGQILNSANAHTGRVARETDVTVQGTGVADNATYHVTQEALAEYVSITNGTDMSVAKEGGQVSITGKSNSAGLKFEWIIPEGGSQPEHDEDGNEENAGVDFPAATIGTKYTAGGLETNVGENIQGDPGAQAEYEFSIPITFPANDAVVDVYRTLKVSNVNGDVVAQIQIVQTAGSARLSVSPTSITIPQSGTGVSVAVTSNTTWTVS